MESVQELNVCVHTLAEGPTRAISQFLPKIISFPTSAKNQFNVLDKYFSVFFVCDFYNSGIISTHGSLNVSQF